MHNVKYILFDVANTLINKPLLFDKMQSIIHLHGTFISKEKLEFHHKILSEQISFPDRTNKDFYAAFNTDLLISLGIFPSQKILTDMFEVCSYLPWEPFIDTRVLKQISLPIGVLSNFKRELPELLSSLFDIKFSDIIVSEEENLRKPHLSFFELAIKKIKLEPKEILYIGDSMRLDYIPAKKTNMNAILIDRNEIYCPSDYIITSLDQIISFI